MAPPPALRALRFVAALWFAFVPALRATHACPMHDGAGLAMAGPHAGHHMAHDGPSSDAPGDSHTCSCIGACTATDHVALAPSAVASIRATERRFEAAVPAARGRTPAAAPRYLLPFATAPPSSIT